MGFAEAIKSVFSKYATFSGRARRSELWFFYLFYVIVATVLGSIMGIAAGLTVDPTTGVPGGGFWVVWAVFMLAMLALVVPMIAVAVRRLHDTDRPGPWLLLLLVPFGWIAILVFTVAEGVPGPNRFGPSPKTLAAQSYATA